MVAALSRSGTNDYALSNQRSFDAWGNVRIGSTSGNPTGRYCANIGHKQDDESGLVYMRARYYEPTSGRFVSEDRSCVGINWYRYASNNPVNRIDQSGNADGDTSSIWWAGIFGAAVAIAYLAYTVLYSPNLECKIIALSGLTFITAWFGIETFSDYTSKRFVEKLKLGGIFITVGMGFVGNPLLAGLYAIGESSVAGKMSEAIWMYVTVLTTFMALEGLLSDVPA